METLPGNLLIDMRIDFIFNQFPNTDHRANVPERQHWHGDRFAHCYSVDAPSCVFLGRMQWNDGGVSIYKFVVNVFIRILISSF